MAKKKTPTAPQIDWANLSQQNAQAIIEGGFAPSNSSIFDRPIDFSETVYGLDIDRYDGLIGERAGGEGFITANPQEWQDLAAENQSGAIQAIKAVPRVVTSTGLKLLQGVGMLGSAVGVLGRELGREAIEGTGQVDISDITDNAVVNALFKAEDVIKSSEGFAIFKPSDWDDRTIWEQIGSTAWWADEFADGAAFALQSAIGAGAIGKLGLGSKVASRLGAAGRQAEAFNSLARRALGLGAKEGTMGAPSSAMQRLIQGASTGKLPTQIGKYTDFLSQVGILTAQESLFEARDTGHQVQQRLLEEAGHDVAGLTPEEQLEYLNSLPEEEREEIKRKKGQAMQTTFLANMAAITFSNMFEVAGLNRLMGQGIRRFVGSANKASRAGVNLGEDLFSQASVIERKGIQRFIGRGSRPRTIAGIGATQAVTEGLYEENIQNSIQNISEQFDGTGVVDYISDVIDDMVTNTFTGDNQAWKSIVTGGLLGGLMGTGAGLRNYRDNEAARLQLINKINSSKANLVNIKDNIYERDAEGNIVLEDGRPKYNTDAIVNLVSNQAKAQDLADLHDLYEQAGNKEIASILWNDAVTDISLSYMEAGFGDQLIEQIKALGNVKEEDLQSQGLETQSTDENGRPVNVQERAARMLETANNVKADYEAITSVIPDNDINSLRINSAVRIASRLRKLNEKSSAAEAKYNELLNKVGLNPVIDINSTIDRIDALKELKKKIEKDSPSASEQVQKIINNLSKEVEFKKETNKATLGEQGISVPSGLGRLVDTNPNTPDKIALKKQASKISEYQAAIQQQLEKYNDILTNPQKFQEQLSEKLQQKGTEIDEDLTVSNEASNLRPGDLVELTDKKTGTRTVAPVQMSSNGSLTINGIDISSNIGELYSSIRPLNEQERQDYIETQAYAFRVAQLNNRIQEIRNDIERLNNEQEKEVENLIIAEDTLASLQSQRLTKKSRVSEKILNDRIVATEKLIVKTQEAIGKYDDLMAERQQRIDEIEFDISERSVETNMDSLKQELDLVREEYKNTRKEREEAVTLLEKLKDYYNFLKEYWRKIFPNKKRVFEEYEAAADILEAMDPVELDNRVEEASIEAITRAYRTGEEYSNFKQDIANTAQEIKQREQIVKELDKRLRSLKRRGELISGEIRQYENFLAQLTNPGVFNPVKGQEEDSTNFPTKNGTYTPLDKEEFRAKKNIADGLFTTTGNSTVGTPAMNRWFKYTEQIRPRSTSKLLVVTVDHPQFGVGKEFDVYKDEPEAFRTKDNIKVIPIEALSDPLGPAGIRPVRIDNEIVSTSLVEITPQKKTINDFRLRDGDVMFHNRDGLSNEEISSIIEDYRQWTDNIKNNPTQKVIVEITGKSFGFINEGPEITAREAFGQEVPTLHISTKNQVEFSGQRYGVEIGMGYVNYNGRPVPAKSRKINQEEAQAILKSLKAYGKIRTTIATEQTANTKARGRQILDKIKSIVFLGKSSNPDFSTYFVKGEQNFAFGNNLISIYDLINGKFDQEILDHLTNLNHQISLTHIKRPLDERYTSITGEEYPNYQDYLMNGNSNNRQPFQVPVKFAIIPRTSDTSIRQIDGMYLFFNGQKKKATREKQAQTKVTPAQQDNKDTNTLSYTSLSATLAAVSEQEAQAEQQLPNKSEPTKEELDEVNDMMLSLLGPNPQEITLDNGNTYLVGIVNGSGIIMRKDDTSKIIKATSPIGQQVMAKVNWDSLGNELISEAANPIEEVLEQQPESNEDLGVFGLLEFEQEDNNPQQGENRVIENSITEEQSPEDDFYAQLNEGLDVVEPTEAELLEGLNLGENPPSEIDIEESTDEDSKFLLASRIRDYNQANVDNEIRELERLVGSKALAGIVRGLIKGKAFGQTLSDGRILLSDIMTEGTAYHEAFHRVFSGIIGDSQRNLVINDWRSRFPNQKDYTDFQVEEELAEEFREYMLTKQHEHKPTENIFRRIWNYLRALLRIPSAVRERLFYKIGTGVYVDVSPTRIIVGNKYQEAPEGFSAVREEFGTVTERNLYEGLTYGFLESLIGNNFNVDDVLNFNDGALTVTDNTRYQLIFNNTFEGAMNLLSRNPSLSREVEFFRNNKKNIFDNFSNHLKRYGITLKEEQENEVVPNEDNRGKDTLGIIESIEFNVKSGVPNSIKLVIASLPSLTKQNRFRANELGLPRLSNYKTNLARLHNALAGLDTIQEMRDKVVELSAEVPEYKLLLRRLGIPMSGPVTPIGLDDNTVKLQTQFKQQFDKANYIFYSQLIDDNGNSYFRNANSDRASDLVKQRWRSNFRLLPKNRLRLVDGRYVYNPDYFEKTYKGKLRTSSEVLSFYKDLGITFTDEDSVDIEGKLEPLAGHFYNAVQKGTIDDLFNRQQADLGGWLNQLIEEEIRGASDITDNQHINAEGKTVYSISLNNYLTLAVRKINKGEADYLTWDEKTKAGNPLARNSHFLKSGYKLKVVNLEGAEIINNERDSNGKPTSKLSRSESSVQQFTAVMNGIFPFIRQSDRKIEYGISLEHSNGARVGLRALKGETIQDAVQIFKGYLSDELLSSWMLINQDVGSDIVTYNKVGRDLRFFKNIFNKSLTKEYQNILSNSRLSRESAITRIDDFVNSDGVVTAIQNMLDSKSEQFFNEFLTNGTIEERAGRYVNNGLPTEIVGEESSYTKEELMEPIQRFTYNYLIGNIEQEKLFTGDVAFYKLKETDTTTSHDFFKRTGGLGGTGKALRNDTEYNEWRQENRSRPDKKVIDGKIQTWVFDDVVTSSSLKKQYVNNLVENFGFTAAEANNLLSGYEGYDEADAQGLITLPEYREMLERSGDWVQSQEIVYQKIQNNEVLTSQDILTLPPLKPQYFGPQTYKDLYVPTFYKLSLMPLIPSVIGENSTLGQLNKDMLANGVGIVTFTSGNKVGKLQGQSFYNEEGRYNTEPKVIQELDYDFMKIQLDMSPEKHHKVTFGTQFRKLILSNLIGKVLYKNKNGGKGFTGDNIIKKYNFLVQQQIELEMDTILRRLDAKVSGDNITVNKVKLANLLTDEAFKRNAPNNVIDDINEALGKGRGVEVMVTRPKIESILMSIMDNTVVHNKVLGDMLVQAASTGFETKPRNVLQEDIKNKSWASDLGTLRFYEYGPNGTSAMEVYLPHRFKELYGQDVNIRDIDPKLLELVGFRIPTQGLNSMEAIKIKGFLPQEAGNLIVLPSEIVAKAGSDFDIDKLTIFLPNYRVSRNWDILLADIKSANQNQRLGLDPKWFTRENIETLENEVKNGIVLGANDGMVFNLFRDVIRTNPRRYNSKIEYVPYDPKNLTKEGIQNEIIRITRTILLAPENFKDLITPISSEILQAEARMIRGLKSSLIERKGRENYFDLDFIMETREAYLTGKDGVGIAASNLTHHTLSQIAGLRIAPNKTIINLPHNSIDGRIDLSRIWDAENESKGNTKAPTILDTISAFLNGFVDIAKDPFLKTINADTETAGIYLYLLRAGVPLRQAVLFMNQPIILRYLENLKLGRSMFRIAKGTEKSYRTIEAETRAEYGGSSFDMSDESERNQYLELLSDSNMKKAIRNELGQDFDRMQIQVLNDFLEYQKASKKLLELSRATNSDTRGTGPSMETAADLLERFESLKREGYFENVDKFETETVIGTFNKAIENTLKTYKTVFPILQREDVREIMDNIKTTLRLNQFISQENIDRTLRVAENDFISFLFQNSSYSRGLKRGSLIEKYFSGDNSLPKQIARIKGSKDPIRNNLLIQELYPILSSSENVKEKGTDFDNLKFFSRRIIKEHADDLSYAWEELFNKQPDLANRIFTFAVLQSSFNNSPLEFLKYAPPKFTSQSLHNYINNDAMESDIDLNEFYYRFLRNNWRNSDLVPYTKRGMFRGGQYTSFLSKDWSTITANEHHKNYHYVKTSVKDSSGNTRYLLFENTYETAKNRDKEYPLFRRVGLLGNGYFFKEYATEVSVITENRAPNDVVPTTVDNTNYGDTSNINSLKAQILSSNVSDELKGVYLDRLERATTTEQKAEIFKEFCQR